MFLRATIVSVTILFASFLYGYEAPKNLKVAVLNDEIVVKQAEPWRVFSARLNDYVTQFQQEIRQREGDIRKNTDEMQKNRANIPTKEYGQRQANIQKSVVELNDLIEKRRKQLDIVFIDAQKIVYDKMKSISEELGKKYHIDLILIKSNQNYGLINENLEITGEVLNLLNARLPMITWRDPASVPIETLQLNPTKPTIKGILDTPQ